MRKLRHFFAVIAMIACCATMMGCDDIIVTRSEIYGTWLYSEQYYNKYDQKYEYYKELRFSVSGNYDMTIEEYLDNRFYDDYYESGTYYCNGWDELDLTYYDDYYGYRTEEYNYEVYGDKLILDYYVGREPVREIYYRKY